MRYLHEFSPDFGEKVMVDVNGVTFTDQRLTPRGLMGTIVITNYQLAFIPQEPVNSFLVS